MAGFTKDDEHGETQAAKRERADTACVEAASTERIARAEMFNAIAAMLHAIVKLVKVHEESERIKQARGAIQ